MEEKEKTNGSVSLSLETINRLKMRRHGLTNTYDKVIAELLNNAMHE